MLRSEKSSGSKCHSLHKLEAKLSVGELLDMKVKGQNMELVHTADEADEAYTYEWALNPADVTKLLNA